MGTSITDMGTHLEVAQPLCEISSQQFFDEILAVPVKVPRELDLSFQDFLEQHQTRSF